MWRQTREIKFRAYVRREFRETWVVWSRRESLSQFILFIFLTLKKSLVYLFILRKTETAQVEEGKRKRERENPKQVPRCLHRAWCRAQIHQATRSWPESKPRVGCLTDWATQSPLKVEQFPYINRKNRTNIFKNYSDLSQSFLLWNIYWGVWASFFKISKGGGQRLYTFTLNLNKEKSSVWTP